MGFKYTGTRLFGFDRLYLFVGVNVLFLNS
jgi:hypothetical protein